VSPRTAPRLYYGYIIVFLAFVIGALAWGGQRTFGVFLSPLLIQFPLWSRADASLAVTIQSVTTGIMAIIAGRLSDRFGPRVVMTVCGIIIGVSYLLSFFIGSLWQLYLLQGIILGVGLAGVMVPLTSMVIRWFTQRAGLMNGIVHAGPGFGITVIPPLITLFIAQYDWHRAYLLMGGVVLVGMVVAAQFLKQQPLKPRVASNGNHPNTKTIGNVRSFAFREAIKTRTYWILSLLLFIDIFNLNVVVTHIVVHAKDLQIPAAAAATVLSVTAAVSIAGRIIAGAISDKLGIRLTIGICLTTSILAFTLLLFAKELWMLYLFAAIFGIGGWGTAAVMSPLVAEYFGFKAHGAILGAVSFLGTMGGAIGPFIAGAIFDKMGNYNLAFSICITISVIGLVALPLLEKPAEKGAL
jgi:MFS family permease